MATAPPDRRATAGVVVLAALAPVVALAVDPGGWYPFGPVKWLAVSVLVPVGAALVFATRPARLQRGPTVAALVLLAWMAVSAVVGEDPVYAWTGTPERHFGVLTWALLVVVLIAGQSIHLRADGPVLAWGLVVAGSGIGGLALVEALGWEPALFEVTPGRLTGTFGSAAYLGAATALLLPMVVGVTLDRRLSPRLRLVAGVAIALLVVACLGAGARAAWFGLVLAAVVAAWLRRSWFLVNRRVSLGALAGAAVVVVALVVLTPVGSRLSGLFEPDQPGGQGRLDEWRVATHVVAANPLTGVGPEGYRIGFAQAADPAYERKHGRTPLPDRAHAGPLDVAVAGGVPALVAWSALMAFVGGAAVRAIRQGTRLAVGIAVGLLAHLGGQLLLFPIVELEPVAWLLAGVLLSATSTERPPLGLTPRRVPIGLAALAIVCGVAGVLDVVSNRLAATAVDVGASGEVQRAAEVAGRAASLRPDVVRLHLLDARARLDADEGTLSALAAVDRALAVSPGDPVAATGRVDLLIARATATQVPAHAIVARDAIVDLLHDDPFAAHLWLQRGAADRLLGDIEAAERHWAIAEDLAPDSAGPAINLALLHLEAGDRRAAEAAALRAVTAAPDDRRARDTLDLVRRSG